MRDLTGCDGVLFCRGSFSGGLLLGELKVEGHVGGLEAFAFGAGDVVGERAIGAGSECRHRDIAAFD